MEKGTRVTIQRKPVTKKDLKKNAKGGNSKAGKIERSMRSKTIMNREGRKEGGSNGA